MSTSGKPASEWYRIYHLVEARNQGARRDPAPHQSRALEKLRDWYAARNVERRGGILVLPTGAGKTFTANHFLCRQPLSTGKKVLWLAHTHHLLEQAFWGLEHAVPLIAEPRRELRVRVVSGTTGHFRFSSVDSNDDVVICSLQTACRALANDHTNLLDFLDAAGDELFVVFDEAHHSPAPSYRQFVSSLQDRCRNLSLLGLTATPIYSDRKKQGWLAELFPQGIIHQEEPSRLMADGVLAQPILEEAETSFVPEFDDREYGHWASTYRDIPEHVIQGLAINRQRNELIAGHYLSNKDRFGKTIIFADRWYQCDQLREILRARGVRADVVYSHIDADTGSGDARNRRFADENSLVLRQFRDGKLDVLINVRMLTEGTDVPDVQTVFLTRQTTSQILLTQMVGRALRGPKFGGTEKAFIVSFIDNWKHRINWASYDQIALGQADDTMPEYGKRPPTQAISIALLRRLARQLDSGININPAPYSTTLPIGWYRVEFDTLVNDTETDDIERVDRLVLVFENQEEGYKQLIAGLKANPDLRHFEEAALDAIAVDAKLSDWIARCFAAESDEFVSLADDILAIARHMGQNNGVPPVFFLFAVRQDHDLDTIAMRLLTERLSRVEEDQALLGEYTRQDRLWKSLYGGYDQFKSHYNGCIERLMHGQRHGAEPKTHRPIFANPESVPDREPDDETKREVKVRDGNRCLCCGATRNLTIDHISPSYFGGKNEFDNLQTLCGICNGLKAIDHFSFRNHHTTLSSAPRIFRVFPEKMPYGEAAKDRDKWERHLRCCINFYYQCSAVEQIEIASRGDGLRNWKVRLFQRNPPEWLRPHLNDLAAKIRTIRSTAGLQAAPESIVVVD